MKNDRLQKRDSALDIIRIVAVFSVCSVHFFLNNGFYSETVTEGPMMFFTILVRVLTTVCVPLFMILTGYLMSKKELSKGYYKGIRKTLIVYVLATIACMVVKTFTIGGIEGTEFTLKDFILGTLNYSGATYSWYIEMYIGLFLIAPFLNVAYNGLKTQKKKQLLVFTIFALAVLPSLLNNFNFNTLEWWLEPRYTDETTKILPSFWSGLYPIAYYFAGAYFREYGMKIKTVTLLLTFGLAWFLFTALNYTMFIGRNFRYGPFLNWNCFQAYVLSCMLFVLLTRIKANKAPEAVRWILWKIADLALGAYLLSFIFDQYAYREWFKSVFDLPMDERIKMFFIIVIPIFICSLIASFIINTIADIIITLYEKIRDFVKKQLARNDRAKWQDYAFIALLAAGVTFAIWKAFFGFGGYDESFYLTIPHRLGMGDALFRDEWHLSQMSGVLLLPFVKLYTTIVGSCEGMILFFRFFYVIVHAAATVALYRCLRKYGPLMLFATMLFFMYVPYNIMAYSYNTMSVDLLVMAGALMGTADYTKKLPLILAGLAFAGAVLCSPYLAVAYALYIVCVLAHIIIKKVFAEKELKFALTTDLFSLKTFIWFTVGVAALAVVVTGAIVIKTGIVAIFENLPKMLLDPEHPQLSFMDKLKYYHQFTAKCHPNFRMALWAYGAVLFVMICDMKRKKHRAPYLIASIAITVFCYIMFIPQMELKYYNAMMYPMLFVGITSYILCENKPRTLLTSLFALGVIYSFAVCFSSNQYFYVISMAMSVANIASFVFLAQLIKELRQTDDNLDYALFLKRFALGGTAFMLALLGFCELGIRTNACFWEGKDLSILNTQITCGPAKGIYTTPERAQDYENIYNDIQYFNNVDKDNILCLTAKTWAYLSLDDMGYGTFSAWLSGENNAALSRLDTFYRANPEKRPRYVYVPLNGTWDYSYLYAWLAQNGYVRIEDADSSVGLKYVSVK